MLFAFVALVFEPLYYFGCDWDGLLCPLAQSSPVIAATRDIWLIYVQFDPLFYTIPLWLRVLCCIEVFAFGPLYALTAYGMASNARWLPAVALPFSGALIYSTVVYFAMELLEGVPGTSMLVVLLVNIPWTLLPAVLMHRIIAKQRREKVA